MMVLPIAACLIAAIAVALAAGNHANPQPDVLAAPVLENTESPQPETCVYFTNGGKYYHAAQDCGGMMGAQKGSEDEALALGKSPCPVCLKDWSIEVPTVWCTKNGQYYHTEQFCSHMQNAQSTTPEQAISEGKQPCPVCVAAEAAHEAAYNTETLSN